MQNNIRNTNLRFNLDKEQQRRAWEYLQTMDSAFFFVFLHQIFSNHEE